MNLFQNDKENELEPIADASVSEEKAEDSGGFVLNIEGAPAEPVKPLDSLQDLRGATRTLPGQEELLQAVEAAAEQAASAVETEKAAVEAAKPEAPKPVIPAASAIPEAVIPAASYVPKAAEKSTEKPAEPEKPTEPEESGESKETFSSVSYASVAQAVVNAKKEPTGRFDRDAIDDETLLAELYALIGDPKTRKAEPAPKEPAAPSNPAAASTRPAPAPARPATAPTRPVVRITPDALKDAPEEYVEIEEDTTGAPGWLKGIFILLISLLLSAMTFYAVATDLIGEIF